MIRRIGLWVFFLISGLSYAQNAKIDSLKQELLKNNPDTTYIKIYKQLGDELYYTKEFIESIKAYKSAYEIALKLNNKSKQAKLLLDIGTTYQHIEQYSDALENLFKSLLISEEIKDTTLIMANYNAMGIIYSNQKNHDMALKYFHKYADLSKKLPDSKKHLMRAYNNIGISYKNKKDFKSSDIYYRKALKYAKETGLKRGEMSCYYNIGVNYIQKQDYEKSIRYTLTGLKMARELKDNFAKGIGYINLSECYYKTGDLKNALLYSDTAIFICEKENFKLQQQEAYEARYKIHKALGDYKTALEYIEKFLIMKDSLFNEETNNRLALAEKNYQAIKDEKEMEILKQEKKVNELRVKGLYIISIISLLAFGIFLWRFMEKKKSNAILLKQRDEIAEQKKEITDSINYASRIQQAMLPQHKVIEEIFNEYFIFYKPKDIVSGDFYWFIKINDEILISVADCTGHGVPGALMSMIGSDKLNHATLEKGYLKPADILADINKRIKKALRQDNKSDATRDGMDLALINYSLTTKKLLYSGANRPLWLLRNNELTEYKPTKKSIAGFTDENQIYDTVEIHIQANDSIYLFTDGIADQFGGNNNKKITTKKLREFFLNTANLTMAKQKQELEKFFISWKQNHEQTDDICVIGLKF